MRQCLTGHIIRSLNPYYLNYPPKRQETLLLERCIFYLGFLLDLPLSPFLVIWSHRLKLNVPFAGSSLISPVGLHGRLDPDLKAIGAMNQFGFGFVEVGPITLKPVEEGWVRRGVHRSEIEYEKLDANSGLEKTYHILSNLKKNGSKLIIRVRYQGDLHILQLMMDRLLAIADLFVLEGITEEIYRKLKVRYPSISYLYRNSHST